MVYCELIKKTKDSALYTLGGPGHDNSGILHVFKGSDEYEIIKEPEKSKVYRVHIGRMLRKHADEIKDGIFREKMSWEI